jgi:hypothetical protein
MPRIPTPLRLTLEDFDAFLPAVRVGGQPQTPGAALAAKGDGAAGRGRGGRTGPATRARLDLAARMLRWARSVVRRLEDQGIDVKVVAPGFGAGPRPHRGKGSEGQRVLIQESEPRAADAEMGARWVLHLDDKGVDVALEIPASGAAALRALREALSDEERRSELSGIVETLPEQFTFGLAGEAGVEAQDLSAWASVLDRSVATGRAVRLGWSVPRDVAVLHSSVLDEQLEDSIVLLAPVYQLLAEVTEAGRQERGGRNPPRLAKARPLKHDGSRPARPILRTARSAPAHGGRREREAVRQETSPFERGTRVRVLAGPFAGKVGIVKEVDGKGRAQVMLGLLATRIDLADLSASAGGRRPTLSSSHRKPLALR